MKHRSLFAVLLVQAVLACSTGSQLAQCPDLSGSYQRRDDAGLDLGGIFGMAAPSSFLTLANVGNELRVTSGASHRTLLRGRAFECDRAGLSLLAPVTSGYGVPGVVAEHVDRYYTFSKAQDGSLVARTTDRERVNFMGPELTTRGVPGPQARWLPVNRR